MSKDTKQTKLVEDEIVKDRSEEQLTNELEIVAHEILERQKEENLKVVTNPSAIALTTTKHSSGSDTKDVRKTVKQLFNLYLTNQFVARAIQIRADTLVSRGYEIVGEDKRGVKFCEDLIKGSGDTNLFWQLSVNTDIAGDGFLEKIKNMNKNKILRFKHIHPLTLQFTTTLDTDRIIVDNNGLPKSYTQFYIDSDGAEQEKIVQADNVAHLRYNTLGDEFTGISTIQSGYDTIVRLMNMEYSAAEAAVKTANPIYVGKCNTKSPHQIAMWGTILGRISGRDQLFIPQDMEIDLLSPGPQNFSDYSDYFLDAVVATFGVPKAMLLGEGGGGNRAEAVVLSRHFYSLIRSMQKYQEDFFYEVFKEYGEMAGFEAPRLQFGDVAEDAAVNSQSAIDLYTADIIDRNEARAMIGLYPTNAPEEKKIQTTDAALKDSDMKTFHPAKPGSPEGSQKNEKKDIKNSEFSTFTGKEK